MHAFLGGVANRLACETQIVGGTEDHVHLLCRFSRKMTIGDWVKELKRASCVWIRERDPAVEFFWQAGYGVFSVSVSALDPTFTYIVRQEEHHKKATFQDELRIMLNQNKVEWDERYIWD